MDGKRVFYSVPVRDQDAVRVVTLDRPERRNALDLEIRLVLAAVFEEADADSAVWAVVLAGRDGAFCSGGDISIMQRTGPDAALSRLHAAQRIVRAIAGGATPVVAAVDGPSRALGLLKRHFAAPPADLHSALDRKIAMQAELTDTDDYAGGLTAVTQKRRPRFAGM